MNHPKLQERVRLKDNKGKRHSSQLVEDGMRCRLRSQSLGCWEARDGRTRGRGLERPAIFEETGSPVSRFWSWGRTPGRWGGGRNGAVQHLPRLRAVVGRFWAWVEEEDRGSYGWAAVVFGLLWVVWMKGWSLGKRKVEQDGLWDVGDEDCCFHFFPFCWSSLKMSWDASPRLSPLLCCYISKLLETVKNVEHLGSHAI